MSPVNRPSRQLRHQKGKDDTLDAESAARSVLAGQAKALPKSGTSTVEMIRHLKVARDTAVKARSQAMLTIKAIIVSAPSALREQFDRMVGKMTLLRSLAALRPGPLTSTTASAKISLRAIARRFPYSMIRRKEIISEHRSIISKIKAHDAAGAAEVVRQHILGSGRHIVEHMRSARNRKL